MTPKPKNRFWELLDLFVYKVLGTIMHKPWERLYVWVQTKGFEDFTEEERRELERHSRYRDLMWGAEALEGLIKRDPNAALAHRAVRLLMKAHYPDLEEQYYDSPHLEGRSGDEQVDRAGGRGGAGA